MFTFEGTYATLRALDSSTSVGGKLPRPKKPGKRASASQWEIYWKQMDLWQQEQNYRHHGHTGQQQGRPRSTWTPRASEPPNTGVVDGTNHLVSFKTGGPSGDEILIADGDYHDDNMGFAGPPHDRGHDHYGPSGATDRGKYTGPGH